MKFEYTPAEDNKNPLAKYGRNLNQDVIDNKVDPIIGRDDEIRRLVEIISRKTKNNPVLIGEPGVGKTAIVEGLAQRIVNNDVPDNLRNKTIYELSLPSLISGASFQGQFEERLNAVIKQVKDSNGDIILFIDEVHQLVGTGRSSNSSMDAANIFKPMMARGEVKIIGATTLNEYRQYIEKDAALERRMQKILVKEPTKQETLTIMRGLKERWELFHQVKIHDSALIAAVNMSDRYISDRFLPDKAIDLIDEAAARVKTEMHSLPVALDQINREIIHIETEKAALMNENDDKSKARLKVVEKELSSLKEEQQKQQKEWKRQKDQHQKLIDLKKELDDSKQKVDRLQMDGEFEKASKLLYVAIPDLQKKIDQYEKNINGEGNLLIRDSVTTNEVAEVIAKATGIHLNKLIESERTKLLNLDRELKLRVKGQNEAVDLVAKAVLRGRAGINDPSRPIGSFLFIGPTGVGKTELSKALASELFDSEKSMIRFDMSEYMEKHSISKLIGAPPGYVGYEQAGALTEAVRRRPYAVILFDEIEKAHADVLNILLQVLDDGQLKDSQGRLVNFKNTIIIMTTNIGSQEVLDGKKEQAINEIKKYLKPEFINRIDELIVFNALNDGTIHEIIQKMLEELSQRLKGEDINVTFDENLYTKIKKEGYDINYGARPIKRYIQKHLENFLAEEILSNQLKKNKSYRVALDKDKKIVISENHKH
ncbi:MAG: AAA family ATPase [Mycoplasmataceae bacterium]|nr:AAA family ATPase [Mycoplasmataceae bacterium]